MTAMWNRARPGEDKNRLSLLLGLSVRNIRSTVESL